MHVVSECLFMKYILNGLGGPLVNWPLQLLDRIADLQNVVAIKEDAKDDTYSKSNQNIKR